MYIIIHTCIIIYVLCLVVVSLLSLSLSLSLSLVVVVVVVVLLASRRVHLHSALRRGGEGAAAHGPHRPPQPLLVARALATRKQHPSSLFGICVLSFCCYFLAYVYWFMFVIISWYVFKQQISLVCFVLSSTPLSSWGREAAAQRGQRGLRQLV